MPSRPIVREVSALLREETNVLRGVLVDVGCGDRPYRSLISAEQYIGVDLDPAVKPDVVGSATDLPLEDASADAVLCISVIEEVDDPLLAFREFARVLRPGGALLVVATQNWRELQTHDYFRYTRLGLALLAERAGLEVVSAQARGGLFAQLGAKLDAYGPELAPAGPLRAFASLLVRPFVAAALALDRVAQYKRDPLLVALVARKP
jgi:SAM-dependent methyltransferase